MNSNEFFANHQKKWVNKQGVYVIENELFSDKLGKGIYKIGMARDSLAKRIADYRTAYSPLIPFKIHLIYEVPEATGGKRANYALLTEAVIHATLKKAGKWADAEWYYDLEEIMNTVSAVRQMHLREIEKAKDWDFYTTKISTKSVNLVAEDSIKSTLKNLITMTTEEKDKRFRGEKVKMPQRYRDD